MPVIPLAQAYTLKNALLTIEADDFTQAVSQAQFDPKTAPSTWRGIGGHVVNQVSAADWTLTLGLAQDLDPAGLARYLHLHEGEEREVTLSPIGATGPDVSATVIIVPGTIGGSADGSTATATVALPVQGRPEFTDPI